MTSNQLEIEVKSLLWNKQNADNLLMKIKELYPSYKFLYQEKQLNHYFFGWDYQSLFDKIRDLLTEEQRKQFQEILSHGKNHSIRTRRVDTRPWVILVIKASLDEHTSHNGISRIEFEPVLDMNIKQLDQLLLDSGFEYLSKRSRERQEYELPDVHISIDKNVWGYGYLAEFEMVIDWDGDVQDAHNKIKNIMANLWVEELDQGRLERMFSFYNANRPDYYGTDNVFTIE